MDKVRLGIIGVGNMGSGHLSNIETHKLCPEITVTAVADIKPDRLDWVKQTFEAPIALFDNAEKMMDSGLIDAVLIAVPHYSIRFMLLKHLNGDSMSCAKSRPGYTQNRCGR